MPAIPQTAEIDPNEIRTYELIPPGWYNAEMVNAEVKMAKSGNGEYLNLEFSLLDPPHAQGRRVWLTLNLWNANAEAVRIANQQRYELLAALGKPNAQDTAELLGIPVCLRVAVREDKTGQYEPRNEVKGFRAAAGAAVVNRAVQAVAARPTPAAAKPWQKATA